MLRNDMDEVTYRRKVQETYDRIERAFESVDPDLAECNVAMGALTITLADQSRCILSSQPSVRQIWLALAAKGIAFHFDLDPATDRWIDDKGKGLELLAYLRSYLKEATKLDLTF